MSGEFAFGSNHVDGCSCPAQAAGFDVSDDIVIMVAEEYDDKIRAREKCSEGIVGSYTAKTVWDNVIDDLEQRLDDVESPDEIEIIREQLDVARKVADTLSW
jgi:hypothetical protein